MSSEIRYRPDIDGLRAVAIVPIVLFHAGLSEFSGGFVGVDIFFVISGYLITSILMRELGEDRFSVLGFYHRRVVRILPALIALVVGVYAVGAAMLLPIELERLGASSLAALLFSSNLYFWQSSDYFAPAAELMPLLHTWSLGVEEQFYIFFPLILAVLWKFARQHLGWIILAGLVLSLVLCAIFASRSTVATFYLLPFRAWELLVGSALAVGLGPKITGAGAKSAAATLGALLLAVSILFVRADMGFPFPWAILPVIGTALLIAYGETTWVGRALSNPVARWLGLISYSTYLWHWPIITLYRIETGLDLDLVETIVLCAASVALGAVSYYLVERPFMRRFRKSASPRKVVFAGLASILAIGSGVYLTATSTQSWRGIDAEAAWIASFANYTDTAEYHYQFRRGPCFRGEAEAAIAFDRELCTGLSRGKPNVAVVGDSYAAQYWRAFALAYPNRNVMQATASGCRPVLARRGESRCREAVDHVLGPLLDSGDLEAVVLAGRWVEDDLPFVAETIRHIEAKGARAILVGPTVEYHGELPSILGRAKLRGDPGLTARWRDANRISIDRALDRIVSAAGGEYVSPIRAMCEGPQCRELTPDGEPMQFDYGHLTLQGALYVVKALNPLRLRSNS